MRLFLASALLAATVAMPAMAASFEHFSRDGETYSYKASRQADGTVLLHGVVDRTGEAFNLRVRGTRVDGELGVSSVSFRVSPATAARLADEVPADGTMPTALAAN